MYAPYFQLMMKAIKDVENPTAVLDSKFGDFILTGSNFALFRELTNLIGKTKYLGDGDEK